MDGGGGGVSTRSDDGAPVLQTQQPSDVGASSTGHAQQASIQTFHRTAEQALFKKRVVRVLSHVIGLDGPVEGNVTFLLGQYALWASCMLVVNKLAVGSLSNPTVLLVVQLAFACAAVPVMQAATPVMHVAARGLPATLPTQVVQRLGLTTHQKGPGAGVHERQPVRYFPGITASLHWLVTGIGFLLSIWCSIATLKHGDVSWWGPMRQDNTSLVEKNKWTIRFHTMTPTYAHARHCN